jgi:hypothetical protein
MELHKIDSIQELRQERLRLQQEANVARELLHRKVQGTLDSGKKSLLGSWKAIIPLVITAGIKQFAGSKPRMVSGGEDNFFATFQEGFNAFQRPGSEKWVALFPILLRLWEQWQDRQSVAEAQSTTPIRREAIVPEAAVLSKKAPVFS